MFNEREKKLERKLWKLCRKIMLMPIHRCSSGYGPKCTLSLADPPPTFMFSRAGGGDTHKKRFQGWWNNHRSGYKQLSSALSHTTSSIKCSCTSPTKQLIADLSVTTGEDKSTLLPFHSRSTWGTKSVGVHYLVPIYMRNIECRAAVWFPCIWGTKSVGRGTLFGPYIHGEGV